MKRRHSMNSPGNSSKTPKRQQTCVSLLMLNDHCLLELYKYLGLDDFISLSRTCQHLKHIANLFNKVYSAFKINVNVDNKRKDYLEYVISNIDENITEISIDYKNSKIPMNVRKLSEGCPSVNNLAITNWEVNVTECDNHCFDNLETLTMTNCDFQSSGGFFEIFKNLKAVNFCQFRNLTTKHLEKLFRKNSDIESFVWNPLPSNGAFDQFELFVLLPKLAAVGLKVDKKINDLDLSAQLNNLTKLQLFCSGETISEFLHKLAKTSKNSTLKELELIRVRVDDLFFYALYYFQQLELLAISTWSYWELKPPVDWPQKLKHLRLESFIISMDGFMWTIKQLESLEDVDVESSTVAQEDRHFFKDLDKLSQVISPALAHNRKRVNFLLNIGYQNYANQVTNC